MPHHFRNRTLAVLFCASSLVIPTHAQTSQNLIVNGNFETDADGNNWPDHWGNLENGRSWEKDGNNRFYRMKAVELDKMTMLYRNVRLPEGTKALELSWKQRLSDFERGELNYYDARIIVNFKDGSNEAVKGAPNPAYTNKNSTGWESKSIKFLIPENVKSIDVMPALFKVKSGTLDLDDLTLVAIDAAPLQVEADAKAKAKAEKNAKDLAQKQENALKNMGADGNILANGDFQQGTGSIPDKWGATEIPSSWVNEEGNRYLRLTSTEPDKMVKYFRLIDLPAGVKALELKWKQRVSGLKIGNLQHYDARIVMNFKDINGQTLKDGPNPAYTQKDTGGWVERSTNFLVPEEAVSLELMPMLFNVKAGTFELDNLSLKAIEAAPLIAAKIKKDAEDKFNNVAPEAPNKAKWPTELRVEGTKVLNKEGQEVLLRGVNVPSLGWKPTGENVLRSVMVAVDDWKSNAIRLPVKEDMWFGTNSEQKDGGVAYRKLVDDAITMAANRGAYTVLDLHRFRAPKQVHIDFWKDAAAKYKDHPTVIFDVFNEPYSISWKVWRDGGFVEDKNAGPDEVTFLSEEEKQVKGFKSVGMQALVDAIRGVGAKNVVIVGGLDYSYDLSGMANGYLLDEKKGNGMMLSTHIYSQKRDYPGKVLVMADKYPIFVGEFGANTKKFDFMPAASQEDAETWMPKIFGFMQKHKMHYTAWSFHPSAGPVMLQGWDYAPTPEFGAVVKRALGGEQFPYAGMR